MSIQPTPNNNNNNFTTNYNVSDLEKQINMQNMSFQSNAQGNSLMGNGMNNPNQSFNMFQNRMSGQSNGKMSIDSIGYNPNLIGGISGIGNNGEALNNMSPDKSMNSIHDSFRNNSLYPQNQLERKTIGGMSNIDRPSSEYFYDPNFDMGMNNNQRCSLEDTLQMSNNRNSLIQNSFVLGNNILNSNRNSAGIFSGRYSSGIQNLQSMYNQNVLLSNIADDKYLLQNPNGQNQPQSYRININQFGFINPQYLQQIQTSQMQSTLGETNGLENGTMAGGVAGGGANTQGNSASAMSLEQSNFEKFLNDQLEQPNRNGEMIEQFAITSSTNQVTYPSSISTNQNFYNLGAGAGQGISQSQFRFASGMSSGNTVVQNLGQQSTAANNNMLNIFNPISKSTMQGEFTSMYGNETSALKYLQQQQQQQQILLSSGSGMIDIGAMNFGNNSQQAQNLLQQQFNGKSNPSSSAATTIGMTSTVNDKDVFDPIALINNLKTENEDTVFDKNDKKTDNENKQQGVGNNNNNNNNNNSNVPNIGRGAAFTTKLEANQDDIFGSMLNPFDDNNDVDRQMSLTNDNINKTGMMNSKMSISSNNGINRSINNNNNNNNSNIKNMYELKRESMLNHNESLSFNEIKQEKESIGGLGDLGSAINFQNNNSFNVSGFASGGHLSLQRGSNLLNMSKNNRASLMNRLSNNTRPSDCNRISFPTFDYDQKLILENNGIPYRDQNGNLIIPQSNRSSAMNSESQMQDEEEKNNKKKAEEIITCNCGKTKCLKLYCVCFQQGLMCSDQCRCSDCYNKIAFMEERERAIKAIKNRYPDAFEKKVNLLQELTRKIEEPQDGFDMAESTMPSNQLLGHKRGCNCKKSACKKKYCECFLAGVKCTYLCHCEACQNGKNDGPDQQGKHINIEGSNIVDQENYNKGNVVSIKTENNSFGNIRLEIFRPTLQQQQQQFITKIERNSNQFNENSQFEEMNEQRQTDTNNQNQFNKQLMMMQQNNEHGQINMEQDEGFNGDKLNHSRFTISELENNYTSRKKQKNNDEDIFETIGQEKQTNTLFDYVFSNNNNKQMQQKINNNSINNESNNNSNQNKNDNDTQSINNTSNQQLSQNQLFQEKMIMQQQQNQHFINNNFNNFTGNKNININNFNTNNINNSNNNNINNNNMNNNSSENNGFDFTSVHQKNNEENVNISRKNMQFINTRRGANDDNDFIEN